SADGGGGLDAVRHDRKRRRSDAHGGGRLRHKAVSYSRAAQQTGPRRAHSRSGAGKPRPSRAASHAPRIRRSYRAIAQDAAGVPAGGESEPAYLSRAGPGRKRNGKGADRALYPFFWPATQPAV